MYRLALAMGRPVGELNLSPDELAHWFAFDKLYPLPDVRSEYMLAQLAALLVTVNLKKGKKPPAIAEFMISHMQERPEPDVPEGAAVVDPDLVAMFERMAAQGKNE